jgi:hypothetical protein
LQRHAYNTILTSSVFDYLAALFKFMEAKEAQNECILSSHDIFIPYTQSYQISTTGSPDPLAQNTYNISKCDTFTKTVHSGVCYKNQKSKYPVAVDSLLNPGVGKGSMSIAFRFFLVARTFPTLFLHLNQLSALCFSRIMTQN